MAQINPYTMWPLDVVKSHCKAQGSAHDDSLARLADGVSARIESFTNRRFALRTITDLVIDNKDAAKVRLPDYPVNSITKLETRWTFTSDWLELDASLYELDERHGVIYAVGFVQGFYTGPRTVRVTYSVGLEPGSTDIPRDIYDMGLDYVKFLYDRWRNDLLITQNVSEGGKNATVPQELPKDLKEAFSHYIKRRI